MSVATATGSAGFQRRAASIADVEVCVTSYQIGKRYCSRVDNVNPGGNIGRGMGATREEAELASLAGWLGLPHGPNG